MRGHDGCGRNCTWIGQVEVVAEMTAFWPGLGLCEAKPGRQSRGFSMKRPPATSSNYTVFPHSFYHHHRLTFIYHRSIPITLPLNLRYKTTVSKSKHFLSSQPLCCPCFTIVNFARAVPVVVQEVHRVHVDVVDVAEDGTATSQKR